MKEFDDVFVITEELEIHPIALLIPQMEQDEFDALKDDILGNGLLEPVIVCQGMILDGRHRYKACRELEIDCYGRKWEGGMDPIEYVVAKNIKRRHLTVGQRAMAAEAIIQYIEQDAKDRQRAAGRFDGRNEDGTPKVKDAQLVAPIPQAGSGPPDPETKTREKAGRMFGVSGRSVSDAKIITQKGTPEEVAAVKAGKAPLKPVAAAVRQRAKAESSIKDQPTKKENKKPDYEVVEISGGLFIQKLTSESKPTFNATNESIEWAKWSWNPVTGCRYNCPYCYAKAMAENEYYSGTFLTKFNPTFHPGRLTAPDNHRVPDNRKDEPGINNVFLCSMADLFGEWVPDEWINKVLDSIKRHPEYNFIALTKNPKRYLDFDFPKNVWLGATADTQKRFDIAIGVFREMYDDEDSSGDNIKFLSCEPLLEKIDYNDDDEYMAHLYEEHTQGYVDWVVIGGLKGSERSDRQPKWEWVENLINFARKSNAAVYFKTNLTVVPKEFPLGDSLS